MDLDDLVDEANKCPCNRPNKDGDYECEAKADKPVGRTSKDSGAQITSCYRWFRTGGRRANEVPDSLQGLTTVRLAGRGVQCPGRPFREGGAAVGLDVYVENQVHEQRYAGVEAGSSLQRLVAASDRERHHLVSRIDSYGDTMINLIQLPQLTAELDEIASRKPELRVDVQALGALIEEATRARGYLWISGD
ncbi:hypothetical protein ACQRWP_07010 [Micromonospora trifolii]|uniref:hypothetical protein n=1 Tax=Micromonospora trifolii TaxID=2911208 RepID=UPI003D2F168D